MVGPSLLFTLLLAAPLPLSEKAPEPVNTLEATSAANGVLLTWESPPGASFARIMVRYRTDGFCPTSPLDGVLALDQLAIASTKGSFRHVGVQSDLSYCYSVFVIDAAGNASVPRSVQSPNSQNRPPATVHNVRGEGVKS